MGGVVYGSAWIGCGWFGVVWLVGFLFRGAGWYSAADKDVVERADAYVWGGDAYWGVYFAWAGDGFAG